MQRTFKERWCLFNTTYHLTLSQFDEGKEIRIVCSKMAWKSNARCCLDVAATLWQRLDSVGEWCCHNVGNRCRLNSHFRSCHNVVTKSLCQLGGSSHPGGICPDGVIFLGGICPGDNDPGRQNCDRGQLCGGQ